MTLLRIFTLSGSLMLMMRLEVIRRIASMACRSVIGECAIDTNASMAWVRASKPVHAVKDAGILVSVTGSIKARSGTIALLIMVILQLASSLTMTANWDTSAELPPVVATQISGGRGFRTRSTPS